jgi:hypothetical protein
MAGAEPIARVTQPKDGVVKMATGRKKVVSDGEGEGSQPEAALSDGEWLEKFCGEVRHRLPNTAIFDRDAILYRRLVEARAAFKHAAKKAVADARKTPGAGGFLRAVAWLLDYAHPSKWLVCGTCSGHGVLPATHSECTECYGACFKGTRD